MSILIVGADRIQSIRGKLEAAGATRITHWDGRKAGVAKNRIPEHVEMVIFFTDFLHHSAAKKLKTQVKARGLRACYCRRAWSEVGRHLEQCPLRCDNCSSTC